MQIHDRIFVAGHRGLVGSAIVRALEREGHDNLLLRTSKELDLTRQADVEAFFEQYRPDYVFVAAAKVGGIHANSTYPADFIRNNLQMETNIIESARVFGTTKLLFLGSTCIYPKLSPQPITEDSLLTGPLEPTNEWYAVAKIAGIKLCQAFHRQYGFNAISLMPTNLYGPGDNYHPQNSHVVPGLLRRFHEAKQSGAPTVEVWGTGKPLREFLHVDDLADACLFLMHNYDSEQIINVGSGQELSIKELVYTIKDVTGYAGEIVFNADMPDGAPRKLCDSSRLFALGWRPRYDFLNGLKDAYAWFLEHVAGD